MAQDAPHDEEVEAAASVDNAQGREGTVFIETRDIPLERISLADNVRRTIAGIDELAASFAAQGQLEPCRVRRLEPSSKNGMSRMGSPDEPAYQLIFGYRRHTAATKLGWLTLRCEVWQMEDGACAQQIAENKQREPLSPMEEARMMERIRASTDPPLRKVELAQALGCDPTYVVQRLKLLTKLAPGGREALEAGRLSVSVVEEIMRLEDEEEQEKAVKNAVRYGWSVRQTLHHVRRVQEDRAQAEVSTAVLPASGITAAIPALAITELPRLAVREALSEGDVRRGLLYALLRNGMDRELLDYLAECHQVSFEELWLYVSRLSDGQVDELSRPVLVRYLSAPHRYPSLEPELRAFYGDSDEGSDDGGAPGTVPRTGGIVSIDPLPEEEQQQAQAMRSPSASTPSHLLPIFCGPFADLPPLADPAYGGLGPYASSPLRGVVGARINPDAYGDYYAHAERELANPESKLSCFHPQLSDNLSAILGFDPRLTLRQLPASQRPLSGVIPMLVPGAQGKLPFPVPAGSYLIAYSQLVRHPGGTLESDGAILRLKESLSPGSSLLLTFHGHYEHLNAAWMQDGFWDQPFLAHFDGVIIDNFDPFSNSPRPMTLQGERMHQLFMEDGCLAGHNVIPALAWAEEDSLRRQVELLASNPRINTAYVDAYGPKVDRLAWSWRWLIALERHVAAHAHVRWLVGGLNSAWQIEELHRIFPHGNFALILSRNHFVHAQGGTASRAIQAEKFSGSLSRLEDLRTGRATSTRMPRPDHWPTYAEALRAHDNAYASAARERY